LQRQLSVGTYHVGDENPLLLLLDDLPCERIVILEGQAHTPHRLAFYLAGSTVVLSLELLADS
jgi:hypothetical protein